MLANAVPDSSSAGRMEKVELTEQKSHVKLLHLVSWFLNTSLFCGSPINFLLTFLLTASSVDSVPA